MICTLTGCPTGASCCRIGLSAHSVVSCVFQDTRPNDLRVAAHNMTLNNASCRVARSIPLIDRKIREGYIVSKEAGGLQGRTLHGSTFGLIGGGNIGFLVGKMFHGAFASRILVYDPYITKEVKAAWKQAINASHLLFVKSLDDLYAESDVISIHVPLLPSTIDLIDHIALVKMKSSAILINCSRGGIVNEKALVEALDLGVIAGCGLDVFKVEPPTSATHSALTKCDRLVMT